MRPRDVALALLVGLVVTLIVIWRDADRSDATYVIGAAPEDPLGDVEISGVPRRSFALPRLSPGGRGRVLLQIATYFEPPTATLRLQVLDAHGDVLSRCTIPPARYRDNGLVPCDVPDVSRARRVVVSHAGRARLGVYRPRRCRRIPRLHELAATSSRACARCSTASASPCPPASARPS